MNPLALTITLCLPEFLTSWSYWGGVAAGAFMLLCLLLFLSRNFRLF